jgi:hypothetical protein
MVVEAGMEARDLMLEAGKYRLLLSPLSRIEHPASNIGFRSLPFTRIQDQGSRIFFSFREHQVSIYTVSNR